MTPYKCTRLHINDLSICSSNFFYYFRENENQFEYEIISKRGRMTSHSSKTTKDRHAGSVILLHEAFRVSFDPP